MMTSNAIAALTEQRRLLELEYNEEQANYRRLSDHIGVLRLVARGYARWPVTVGRQYYNSLNMPVVELTVPSTGNDDQEEDFDPDRRFEYGRPVSLFTSSDTPGEKPRHHLRGTVNYADSTRMVVAVDDSADLSPLRQGRAGVMLAFDNTSYQAMFDALARTISAKGRLGELRDIIYSTTSSPGMLHLQPMGFGYLNAAQQEAVNLVVRAKDVAVVHGPPGTGKTTTLVEAVYETLRREPQVMVCAQSNMAVDWISEQLVDRGINVLRIGNPSRVDDKMLSFTYERRFEAHPDYPQLWSIRRAIRELRGARRGSDQWARKVERLQSRATALELKINADIFGQARVIACTLVGSNSRLLEGMRFGTLFIDEAAQALEAACWIAIRRAGRVILAGDHCQLPPTVKCLEAMRGGLGRSLMERVVQAHPGCVAFLRMQYRMHRDIMEWSNRCFYNGMMLAAPEVEHRGILDYDTPVEWVDTSDLRPSADAEPSPDTLPDFREALAGEGFGHVNHDEALLTVEALEAYVTRIGMRHFMEEGLDIGVISPYRAQVRFLRRLVSRSRGLKPIRHRISVNTIDGFQGRERDIMLISLVRSNEQGQIGFLGDLRRMNVAMTRARMKLIIIGDAPTLGAHPFYRRLKRYIDSL